MEERLITQSKLTQYWEDKIEKLFSDVILLEYNYKYATFLRNNEHITLYKNGKIIFKEI